MSNKTKEIIGCREAKLRYVDFTGADIRPADFTGADLRYADFTGVDLRFTDFTGADLSHANLSNADMRGAIVTGADMIGTKLICTNMVNATLIRTNMAEATLTGATLVSANLSEADLTCADLTDTDLTASVFTDSNLSGACLRGVRMLFVIGDGVHIKNIRYKNIRSHEDLPYYGLVYTDDILQIGCKNHRIAEWRMFDDDIINDMDLRALKYWHFYRDTILAYIEENPAAPAA